MSQKTSTSSRLPLWIERAREYIGVKEDPSPVKDNPQIIDFLRSTDVKTKTRVRGVDIPVPGGQRYLTEEIPWCAAFVNYCLKESRMSNLPSNSASVKSWKNYGVPVLKQDIRPGDIVFFRGDTHVGFATSAPKDGKISIISGNKGGYSVDEKTYSINQIADTAQRPISGYYATTGSQLTADAAPPPPDACGCSSSITINISAPRRYYGQSNGYHTPPAANVATITHHH
ncbi:MAG: CHAP domain-containing protein [Holosporales bacterium]